MSFMFRPPLWKVLLYKVVYNQPIIIVLGDTTSCKSDHPRALISSLATERR